MRHDAPLSARPPRRRRRRWPWWLAALLALIVAGVGVLTDAGPGIDSAPPPGPRQAAAARGVLEQLQRGAGQTDAPLALDAGQLEAVAAAGSNALAPVRLAMTLDDFGFGARASLPLPLRRWLNVGLRLDGEGDAAPEPRATIGSLTLGPWPSRMAMRTARALLRWRGIEMPDAEATLATVRLDRGRLAMRVTLGEWRRAASQLLESQQDVAGTAQLVRIYCRLAEQHARKPAADFATLVRRGFAVPPAGADVAAANRDALIALAMIAVDERLGALGGVGPAQLHGCSADGRAVRLHGRNDSPKHWLVSAAIAATSGTRLSQAAGEWKELADSVSRQSEFAAGDASGFSFVDIGADRAGELIAAAAVDPARAAAVRRALARADEEALMPSELLALSDGLTASAFAARYGTIEDPRYLAVRSRIDAIIRAKTAAGR